MTALKLDTLNFPAAVQQVFDVQVVPVFKRYFDPVELAKSIDRMVFYSSILKREGAWRPGKVLVDLGAGLSWFSILAQAFGLYATVVDDFGGGGGIDPKADDSWRSILDEIRNQGIRVAEGDLLSGTLPFEDGSVDVVTSFHCLEHFHHSPKHLFEEIRRILRPGGLIFIGVPNSVNLRKRMSVALGLTNLFTLEEWYWDGVPFRGHVREPSLGELRRLLAWNHFAVRRTLGRNFIARDSIELGKAPALVGNAYRLALRLLDRLLILRPTLCSDIHILGVKVAV